MKNLILLFAAILMSFGTLAQIPAGINYQTVIRDGDGNIMPDTELSLQMTIRSGAPDGAVVYAETHEAVTNAFGLVNLVIGYGSLLSNAFADINWGSAEKYLETAIDLTGGGSYTIMGVTQFLSVPYAFHSTTTELFDESDPDFNAWDKSTGIAITENQITDLQDYLTEETDPEFNAWDKSTGIAITANQISDLQPYLTQEIDGDPGNELQTLSQAGNSVTLSQDGGTITVADNDNLPANELQQLSKAGNTVSLSQGGGSFTDEVDDADNNSANELNTALMLDGTTLKVTDAGSTLNADLSSLIDDADADPANELQTIEEQDYNVSLSQGGGSFMTGVKSYSQAAIDVMTPYNGLVVFNTSTNCLNYYNLNNWFEACGICTPQPTQAAAGDDQAFYDETTEATLAANTPEQETGLWTIESGEGGSFADATLPETTFTGQPCTAYILAWTISNSCGESSNLVDITFFATPTVANAGNDTLILGGELSVNLNANTPEMGDGIWTIISGDGGILDDATNPTTLFTGQPYVEYTLQWAISTACDTTTDEVNVTFNPWQCGLPFTDARDGQSYETVQIDEQCWMAENLAYLPEVSPSSQGNNTDPYYYVYNYQGSDVTEAKATTNYQTYGVLYNWPSSLDACPANWHLPADAEWTTLTSYLGGEGVAGGKMKETGTTHWNSPNTGATNSSGFTGLPGGARHTDGTFDNLGGYGDFWSSTELSTASAWLRNLGYGSDSAFRYYYTKGYGYSVRCLRDL